MSEPRGDVYPADWYPDPGGRFELRYFNGSTWTADVSSAGQRFVDPIVETPQSAQQVPAPTSPSRNGRAIAALVLGVIGLLTAWLPYFFVVGAVCSVMAVAFGTTVLRRMAPDGAGRGPATAGLITGGLGCVAAIGGLVFTIALSNALDAYENPGPTEASITSCVEVEPTEWMARGSITNLDDEPRAYQVDVLFTRAGTDNAQRSASVAVDSVAPGETTTFEVQRSTTIADISCSIDAVNGPAPFGFDFDFD